MAKDTKGICYRSGAINISFVIIVANTHKCSSFSHSRLEQFKNSIFYSTVLLSFNSDCIVHFSFVKCLIFFIVVVAVVL